MKNQFNRPLFEKYFFTFLISLNVLFLEVRFFESKIFAQEARPIPSNFNYKLEHADLRDSAFEVEVLVRDYPQILDMIEPVGQGTLGDIFQDKKLPAEFIHSHFFDSFMSLVSDHPEFRNSGIKKERFLQVKYNDLPHDLKKLVFDLVFDHNQADFFDDRTIPGFKIKDHQEFFWNHSTQFLGKNYASFQKHQVDIQKIIKNIQLEFVGPKHLPKFKGVEFHFRTGEMAAGDLYQEIIKLYEGKNIQSINIHGHLVAPIPVGAIKKEPYITSLKLVEYFRRLNIYDELKMIKLNASLSKQKLGGMISWGFHDMKILSGILDYLVKFAQANDDFSNIPKIGSDFKISYIGFWGHDKYDCIERSQQEDQGEMIQKAQTPLFGFEYRTLMTFPIMEQLDPHRPSLLNSIQKNLVIQQFPQISNEFIQKYYLKEKLGKNEIKRKVEKSTYHSQRFNPSVIEEFSDVIKAVNIEIEKRQSGFEFDLLTYDWSLDPLMKDNKAYLERLNQTQRNALGLIKEIYLNDKEIKQNESMAKIKLIIRDFITQTELDLFYQRSL